MKVHLWRGHILYETWDYFVRKVAVLVLNGWVYFCRAWIIRLFRPAGVTWIFCGFWGWRCLHCCVLPLRNLLDSLDGRMVRLVTASRSKPVAEGDIIATAYVTKTVIAADWICQVSCKLATSLVLCCVVWYNRRRRVGLLTSVEGPRYAKGHELFRSRGSSFGKLTSCTDFRCSFRQGQELTLLTVLCGMRFWQFSRTSCSASASSFF